MVSTAGANVSVGPPYDLVIYRNGSFDPFEARINADSPFLSRLEATWASTCTRPSRTSPPSRRGTWRRERRRRIGGRTG